MHGVEIQLKQYEGWCKGIIKTEPLDVVYAVKGEQRSKIGYVARAPGASLLLIRHVPGDQREVIRREVAKIRQEQGGYEITGFVGSVPDPKAIKAYVKGDLKKTPKTTIVMPDGTPAEEPESDGNDE